MSCPKTIAYCARCGSTIEVGKLPITEPLKVCLCRCCNKATLREGYLAGRAAAMAEFFKEIEDE